MRLSWDWCELFDSRVYSSSKSNADIRRHKIASCEQENLAHVKEKPNLLSPLVAILLPIKKR